MMHYDLMSLQITNCTPNPISIFKPNEYAVTKFKQKMWLGINIEARATIISFLYLMATQLIQTSNFFNRLQGKFGIVLAVYKMAEKRLQYYGSHSAKRAVDSIIDVKWGRS